MPCGGDAGLQARQNTGEIPAVSAAGLLVSGIETGKGQSFSCGKTQTAFPVWAETRCVIGWLEGKRPPAGG